MSTKSSTEPQRREEFGMGGKETRRGRFPHVRKMTVRADSHFTIVFLKVSRVWRKQGPRTRKAYSTPFQFKVMDPDFYI